MQNKFRRESASLSRIENYFLNPTNYTFADFNDTFGFETANAVFTSLYKPGRAHPPYRQIVPVAAKSDSNTTKFVFQLFDKRHIETVVIRRRTGKTLCISTQVGCSVRCKFCKSGKNGFIRNLSASEIVQQFIFINQDINRIVFMGIGEPLLNYEQLIRSIHILRDRNGLDFPTDGISISTVGPPEKLVLLRDEHIKIQLVLSLHATEQKTRDYLIPGMARYSINEIISLAMEYGRRHKRKISIAYLLLPGMNNRIEDAEKLIKWFSNKNVIINILQYNGDNISTFKTASRKELENFKNKLESGNVQVTIRQSLGDSIEAACGQLAIK